MPALPLERLNGDHFNGNSFLCDLACSRCVYLWLIAECLSRQLTLGTTVCTAAVLLAVLSQLSSGPVRRQGDSMMMPFLQVVFHFSFDGMWREQNGKGEWS